MAAVNKVDLSDEPEAGQCSYQRQVPQHPTTSYPHPVYYQQTTQYPHPTPDPGPDQQRDQPPTVPHYHPDEVTVVPFYGNARFLEKSTTLAVVLCVPILGILGFHNFYLNRHYFGYIYAFTAGMFGLGWIIDWFRIKKLTRKCNDEIIEAKTRGYWLYSKKFIGPLTKISLCDAYILWLPPFGLFGFYHYYLGRARYGMYHTFTFGRFGLGWLIDFCRLPGLVRKANADIKNMKNGVHIGEEPYRLCDAYTLAFPFGIFGLHHFYLRNTKRGFLFLFTFGVFGLGWLADLFQMPLIVSEANKNKELHQRLTGALTQQPESTTTTVVVMTNPGYSQEPPPAYVASAGDSSGMNPPYAASAGGSSGMTPPVASTSSVPAVPDLGFQEVPIGTPHAATGKSDFID